MYNVDELDIERYIEPFTFFDHDTETYHISFFANHKENGKEWYVDQETYSSEEKAMKDIKKHYQMYHIEPVEENTCIIL